MINKIFTTLLFFLILFSLQFSAIAQQNDCAGAVALCGNSSATSTTVGATTDATDPALPCGDVTLDNTVWFTVLGINVGTATVTVSGIDNNPGIAAAVYTGSCGALVAVPAACNSANGPAGTFDINFATTAGTTYYIMVDGEAGNQEAFDIEVNTLDDAIIARPTTSFTANPLSGCVPLSVLLENTTQPHGTPVTYEWRICDPSGVCTAYLPASGNDTTVLLDSVGTWDIYLRATNACGANTQIQSVVVQNLVPTIAYLPNPVCKGTPITFNGSALVLPSPPIVNPNVTLWEWDFDNNGTTDAITQNAVYTYTGAGNSFTVELKVTGTCGPDSTTITVNLLPELLITAADVSVCDPDTPTVSVSNITNGTAPYTYIWTGAGGTITCDTCPSTTITGLTTAGSPYTFTVTVTDDNGCIGDTDIVVTVRAKPVVNATPDATVCSYTPVALTATPVSGTAPFEYLWTPSTGLSPSDTIPNPTATVSSTTTYCVTITDDNGCISDPDCITITTYDKPFVTESPSDPLCISSPPVQTTLTVNGAGLGSTYNWYSIPACVVPNTSTLQSQLFDFSACGPGFYCGGVIVTDGVTGCIDTIQGCVTVLTEITTTINPDPLTICQGQSDTLIASGATSYLWSTGETTDSIIVSPAATTSYWVRGTTGSCIDYDTLIVTVNPVPIAVAAPIPDVCGCSTVILNGTGSTPGMDYLWTSVPPSTIASSTSLNTTATVCANTAFILTVTDSATGCFTSANTSVTVDSKPDASASANPTQICEGVPTLIALTGNSATPGVTYSWSAAPPTAFVPDNTTQNPTATISTATVFTLTVTAPNGCDSVVTATVSTYPEPVLSASPNSFCLLDSLPWLTTLTVGGAGGGSAYLWTSPVCAVTTTAPNNSASESFDMSTCLAGNHTFTVTVTDGVTGCISNINTIVIISDTITVTINPVSPSICEGDSVTLTASGVANYLWSPGGATTAAITVSPATTTIYSVIGSTGACSDTDSVSVTVNPLPNTSGITGSSDVCENTTGISYSVTNTIGSTYTWVISGGVQSSGGVTNSITVDWGAPGPGSVAVTETDSLGCSGSQQLLPVTINPNPITPLISGSSIVCQDSVVIYSISPNAGSTYSWSVTGGVPTSGTGPDITVTWSTAGMGTVILNETNAVGCIGVPETLNVTVNPTPITSAITGASAVCQDSIGVTYSVINTPGSTYLWTISGGTGAVIMSGQSTNSIIIDWASTSGTVNVTETSVDGCLGATQTLNVTVNLTPSASATGSPAITCQGTSVQLTGTTANGSILWTTSGSGTFSSTTIASPTYTPSFTDLGVITLTVTVSNPPCPDAVDTVNITVNPTPIVTVSTVQDTICWGDSTTITATGVGTYLWSTGEITPSITAHSPTSIITSYLDTTFSVTVTNAFGCQASDSTTIIVTPPGLANAGADQILCSSDPVTISLNGSVLNASSVVWTNLNGTGNFNPNNTSLTTSYDMNASDTLLSSISFVLISTDACYNIADTVVVNILEEAIVNAGPDQTINLGENANLTSSFTAYTTGVIWTSSGCGSFVPNNTTLNATYMPCDEDFDKGSIVLTITSLGGCDTTSDDMVLSFTTIVFPNALTPFPNSPGQNDVFKIQGLPDDAKLIIFNRWGLKEFETNNYRNDWDAEGVASGVYYFTMIHRSRKWNGFIHVIKEDK